MRSQGAVFVNTRVVDRLTYTFCLNRNFTAVYNILDKPERIIFEGNAFKDIRYEYNAAEDHMGNVRMVLTEERDTAVYQASFEESRNVVEEPLWRNRNHTREVLGNHVALFNNPNPNHHASRLNGADPLRRKGAGLVLRVMAGDTLNISTRALYTAGSVPGGSPAVSQMVESIVAGFLGASTGNALLDGKAWLPTAGGLVVNTNAMSDLVTQTQNSNSNNNTPRAFLKYILLDENFQTVQSHAERVDDGPGVVHSYVAGGQVVVPKNGFVYVFTTNESPVDVWFDDVTVVHRTGPLLQESSFYPFGMEIVPLSSYAAIKLPNDRDYQGNELEEEFGLELHHFDARMYDGQVGRFQGMDVYADKFSGLSPYNYAANNPMYFVDPDGRIILAVAAKFLLKGVVKKLGKKLAVNTAKKAGMKAAKKFKGDVWKSIGKYIEGYNQTLPMAEKAVNTSQTIGSLVGGSSNVVRNWDNITKGGGFDVFRALNYFYAGSVAGQLSALATPIATLTGVGLGGILNVEADFWQGDGTLDREGGFWKSFSRGALSALTAKGISKSFLKGASIDVNPKWAENWYTQGAFGGVEKGTQTVFSNYNKYGPGAAKKFGKGFYGQSFLAGFAGGFVKGAGGFIFSDIEKGIDNQDVNLSSFYIGGAALGGDYTKKIVAKSINKEYKLYLSKNSGFDASPLMNFFFQMFAYRAGYSPK